MSENKHAPDILFMIRARLDSGRSKGAPQLNKDIRVLKKAEDAIVNLRQQRNDLLTVLVNVRNTLESANEMGDGPIVDTIWYGPAETLFDYMDAELDKLDSHGQPEKQANTEPCTKCNTPDLCREYGRACDFGLQLPETSVPALVFYPAGSLGEEVAP